MPEMITNDDAGHAFELVKRICTEVGPGLPGTPQERERAAVFARELETRLGNENVVVEVFILAPGAFLNRYPGLLMLVAAVLNISIGRFTGVSPWVTIIAALALSVLSPRLFIFEFILAWNLWIRFSRKHNPRM